MFHGTSDILEVLCLQCQFAKLLKLVHVLRCTDLAKSLKCVWRCWQSSESSQTCFKQRSMIRNLIRGTLQSESVFHLLHWSDCLPGSMGWPAKQRASERWLKVRARALFKIEIKLHWVYNQELEKTKMWQVPLLRELLSFHNSRQEGPASKNRKLVRWRHELKTQEPFKFANFERMVVCNLFHESTVSKFSFSETSKTLTKLSDVTLSLLGSSKAVKYHVLYRDLRCLKIQDTLSCTILLPVSFPAICYDLGYL